MIKEMLSMNGRISYYVLNADITWQRKPKLEVKKMLNWQISGRKKVLVEVIYGLSKERSREINEL